MKTLISFIVFFLFLHSHMAFGADQRAVLVTGANSGIGNVIAHHLADNGFFVYAGARKAKDIETLSKNKNMLGVRLDVTIQSDIDAAVKLVESEGRGLYGVVNNAGVALFDPLIEIPEDDLQWLMDVNVMGPYRITKAFAPMVIESKGQITNIGSIAGLLVGGPLFGPYGMSKHALEAYTDGLAAEMKQFDVGVSIIEPGNFDSNIMKNMRKRIAKNPRKIEESQFTEAYKRMAGFTKNDRSQHPKATPVAEAVLASMNTQTPPVRYLVPPNPKESELVFNYLMRKINGLNAGTEYPVTKEFIADQVQDVTLNNSKAKISDLD